MKHSIQSTYAEPSDLSSVADEPLVIHQRDEPTGNRALLIFVHGLGGSRYGRKPTWGNFPSLIFAKFPDVDVGLYSYRTLLRRLKFWRSISLKEESEVFAEQIRDDLRDYDRVILFGHSMGGLLCLASMTHLATSGQKESLRRIGGLILAGTPQTGSLRVPFFAAWFSYDFRALKAHGLLVTDVQKAIANHFILNTDEVLTERTVIPTWAILGTHDLWVDPLSARLSLPDSRIRRLRLSHTEIIKPRDEKSDNYVYVAGCLRKCLDRPRSLGPGKHPPRIHEEIEITREIGGRISKFNVQLNDLLVAPYGIKTLLDEYQLKQTDERWKAVKERAEANHYKLEKLYDALETLKGINFFGQYPNVANDINRVIEAKMHQFYDVLSRHPLTPKLSDRADIEELVARACDLELHNNKVRETQDRLSAYVNENLDYLRELLKTKHSLA